MAKSTITREQLEEWVAQFDEDGGCDATDRQLEALIRQSLAAMDSEPVIFYRQVNPVNGMKTYWAELDPEEFRHLKQHTDENAEFMTLYRHAQPAPEYPETLPCPVLLEPGLRFGKGIKTSTMLAALARRAVHESDMAALSPEERAEFQARIEDFKAIIAQPAPVVPEEKPIPNTLSMYAVDAVAAIAEVKGWNACRAAMLAADPQLPGSEPATVPGKWIPVSERMPEDEQEVLTINKMGHRFVSFFDKHSGLFFDRLDAPAACCIEHVLVTHWMPLPATPQEVR